MSDGFTLLELLVSLFFCLLLLVVGNFFLSDFKSAWSLNSAARDICFLVQKGRMAAVKNRSRVTLGLDSESFTVFFDDDKDMVFSGADRLLGRMKFEDYPGKLGLREDKQSFSGKPALILNSRGFLASRSKGGSIYLVNKDRKRRVVISINGVARIE